MFLDVASTGPGHGDAQSTPLSTREGDATATTTRAAAPATPIRIPATATRSSTNVIATDIDATDADGDSEGNGLTYSLTGVDLNSLTIDPDTGIETSVVGVAGRTAGPDPLKNNLGP